jgi:CheY-like chemotaxis protein
MEYRKTVPRILYIEDDPNDIDLTMSAFREYRLAHETHIIRDGEEAMRYLKGLANDNQTGLPMIVLLDVKIPKIGGLEILRYIKTAESLRPVPVVVLSSSGEDNDVKRAYELGANAYVIKPVKFEGFMEAIKGLGRFWLVINEGPVR